MEKEIFFPFPIHKHQNYSSLNFFIRTLQIHGVTCAHNKSQKKRSARKIYFCPGTVQNPSITFSTQKILQLSLLIFKRYLQHAFKEKPQT